MSSISIRRITKKTDLIQREMALANIAKMKNSQHGLKIGLNGISQQVKETAESIERILTKQDISPASLASRSRRAYQWLKFLSDQANLADHFKALKRIIQLLPTLPPNCQKDPGYLNLTFYHISPLYKYQKKENNIKATIQECFIFASDQVLRAILSNILCSPPAGENELIREFTADPEFQERRESLEYLSIPPDSFSAGEVHNLARSFDRVNDRYFNGGVTQPHLLWSRRFTSRKYGDFQEDINTITISRSLDHPRIPNYVVDFVMYHELLHKEIGTKQLNSRRYTHTAEFRNAERRFDRIKDAQKILSSLSRKRI